MVPQHADFITIKKGANLSNCQLHPGSTEDSKILRPIVLEENTFVGLMSLVQGGVTLGACSAVATTSLCKQSLAPYSKQLGAMHMKAPPADELPTGNDDFEVSDFMFFMSMLPSIVATMLMRAYVLGGYMLGVSCVVAVCMGSMDYVPMALILAVAVFGICFFLGVLYMWVMQYSLHPRQEVKLGMMSVWAMCWMQYLQALYLSQAYTLSLINGSWMAAFSHRLLGADTPLDAQWYSVSVRDQPLLTVGHNAVIDRNAYLVGHSGQPDWSLRYMRSSLGDNAVVHPKGIILDGQHLGKGATLDFYSHSHIENGVPENMFYRGNPAAADPNSCVDALNAALREGAN